MGGTWTLNQSGTAVVRGGCGLYYQKTAYSNFTLIAATFLIVRSIRNGGPSRTAQFNIRYDF